MSHDAVSDPVAVRARRRYMRWACLAVAATLLAAPVYFFGKRAHTARRTKAAIAAIAERGDPVTAEQLNAYYAWPAKSLDCTELWLAATQPLDGPAYRDAAESLPLVGKGDEVPPPGTPWPGQEAVEAFLQRYESSLRQMHEAADRGGAARYPLDFRSGIMMRLPHIQMLRSGARLLALEAQVRGHRGDAAGAADSIHAIHRLAGSLRNEPNLVSQVLRMRIDRLAHQQIEALLPHVGFSDDDVRRWREDLRSIENDEGLRRTLTGERALGLVSFQDPGPLEALGLGSNAIWRWTNVEETAAYLEIMNRLVAAAELPWPAVRDEAALVERDLQARFDAGPLSRLHCVATHELVYGLDSIVTSFGEGSAANDAADAALAVELFRRRHGRLPASLAELPPDLLAAVPVDRFDGRPLRFAIREGECVIYSVGSDGVDGGGDVDTPAEGTPSDMGFRLRPRRSGE